MLKLPSRQVHLDFHTSEHILEVGKFFDKHQFDLGARYLGPANFDEDFLVVGKTLNKGLVRSPFLNYRAALRVQPDETAEILATIHEPYFNRTYATYCSHQNTPYQLEQAPHPGALRKSRVIFLPHALGSIYYHHGARIHRDLFINALRAIYTRPTLKIDMPSCGRVNLLHQPEQRRYVAHMLYAPVLQRGTGRLFVFREEYQAKDRVRRV
jgi:hypothetical protein